MNIYKNFLSKESFKNIQSEIMSDYIPWFYTDGVSFVPDEHFQFTYSFVKDGEIKCPQRAFDLLSPLLNKLKYKKLSRIKANLLTKTPTIIQHKMHQDQDPKIKGTSGIFYINTCNGFTVFKNGQKIKSEENKYVEFNSKILHAGTSCTDQKRRIVLNINYL